MDVVTQIIKARILVFCVFCIVAFAIVISADQAAALSNLPGESQSTVPSSFNIAAVFNDIGIAFTSFFTWFWSQSLAVKFQSVGALLAASSVASNFKAIRSVWTSMTRCESLLNFTGQKIGRSEDFQAPMRALFLSFVLYASYQVLSQISGVALKATWSSSLFDAAIHAILILLLTGQFLRIWAMALLRYESDDRKQRRFWKTFNAALKAKRIDLRDLARSIVILPLAAVSPKAVTLWELKDPQFMNFASNFEHFFR